MSEFRDNLTKVRKDRAEQKAWRARSHHSYVAPRGVTGGLLFEYFSSHKGVMKSLTLSSPYPLKPFVVKIRILGLGSKLATQDEVELSGRVMTLEPLQVPNSSCVVMEFYRKSGDLLNKEDPETESWIAVDFIFEIKNG